MRRIFVAVPISPKLQEEIIQWEQSYQTLPVRWIAGKNLHITLIPPWPVRDSLPSAAADAQRRPVSNGPWYEDTILHIDTILRDVVHKQRSCTVRFSVVTFGPRPKQFRLIWAEGRAPQELIALKEELEQTLAQKRDYRPLILHLTLARFRPKTLSSFPIKNLNEKVRWEENVQSVVLMQSHLSKEGAEYEILREYHLCSSEKK